MYDVIEVERRYKAARVLVGDLASGREKWTMHVPVDRERDSDMVLASSLDDIPVLLKKLFEARQQSAALRTESIRRDARVDPEDVRRPTTI